MQVSLSKLRCPRATLLMRSPQVSSQPRHSTFPSQFPISFPISSIHQCLHYSLPPSLPPSHSLFTLELKIICRNPNLRHRTLSLSFPDFYRRNLGYQSSQLKCQANQIQKWVTLISPGQSETPGSGSYWILCLRLFSALCFYSSFWFSLPWGILWPHRGAKLYFSRHRIRGNDSGWWL